MLRWTEEFYSPHFKPDGRGRSHKESNSLIWSKPARSSLSAHCGGPGP